MATRAPAPLVALALLLAGCTLEADPGGGTVTPPPAGEEEPADPTAPTAGGTLRVGLSVDPVSIDPRFVVDDAGELVVDALFDPLVRLDRELEVVPAAAARWDIDDEYTTFTFHLRDATFHDGTPVTAEDFRRSFDRLVDPTASPPSFLGYLLEPVRGYATSRRTGQPLSGIEVVDEHTLVLRLRESRPGFLTTLADPSLVPLPPHAGGSPAVVAAYGEQPVGNGPFVMSSPREAGAFLRLQRFEDHRAPPLLEEVVFTVYADAGGAQQQWEDLRDGSLHVAEVPPAQVDEAEDRFGRSSDGYTGPGLLDGITTPVYLYGFDTAQEPFDDSRVRRAVSMAIDREALADDVMEGARVPATAIVPPVVPGARPGACEYCRHDPEAAAALLDEVREEAAAPAQGDDAGAEDGASEAGEGTDDATSQVAEPQDPVPEAPAVLERLTLTHSRGASHAAIVEAMAEQIGAALDIEVDTRSHELQRFLEEVDEGRAPVFRQGWDTNDPRVAAYLHPLFHSSQIGEENRTRYADAEVDALLEAARHGEWPGAYRAQQRLLDDLPAVPVLWYRHTAVIVPEVRDLYWSPLGRLDLSRAWLRDTTS